MKSNYEKTKEQFILENNFLAEGVFYLEVNPKKMKCFIAKDGLLITDDMEQADPRLDDPINQDIPLFESNGKRYFCIKDHAVGSLRANFPGVIYPLEFKNKEVDNSNRVQYLKKIDIKASDREFVDHVNYVYHFLLNYLNHPSKDINLAAY